MVLEEGSRRTVLTLPKRTPDPSREAASVAGTDPMQTPSATVHTMSPSTMLTLIASPVESSKGIFSQRSRSDRTMSSLSAPFMTLKSFYEHDYSIQRDRAALHIIIVQPDSSDRPPHLANGVLHHCSNSGLHSPCVCPFIDV